jgi:hypothetical protein
MEEKCASSTNKVIKHFVATDGKLGWIDRVVSQDK